MTTPGESTSLTKSSESVVDIAANHEMDLSTAPMKELARIRESFPQVRPLSLEKAQERQKIYGKNILAISKPSPWYMILFHAIFQPFNLILIVLAIVSAATLQFQTLTVMIIMVLLSSSIKFVQELKSSVAAESLKSLVENFASVIRLFHPPDYRDPTFEDVKLMDGEFCIEEEIFVEDIVPGDILQLRAGTLIAGDVQVLTSNNLFVAESALTGESVPVEKHAVIGDERLKLTADERSHPDLCWMGSSVVSGTASVIVLKIGSQTMFGEMALKLAGKQSTNAFQRGIKQVSLLFVAIMVILIPVITVLLGTKKGVDDPWTQALLFSIAVAVGLTPEMLPMIVNANLSKGAIAMSKKRTIVKNLDAIINLGSMDVLCTDKTGTLTKNKVELVKHVDLFGDVCSYPLEMAFLNSNFQTGLKNLLDDAVVEYFQKLSSKDRTLDISSSDYLKIGEIPFDFVRRRMSVIVQKAETSEYQLVSKGALEEMLSICTMYKGKGDAVPLTEELKQTAISLAEAMNVDGLRVLAVGFRNLESVPVNFHVADEKDMVLAGLIAFLDPPKDSTGPAVKELMGLGIKIKVLTGDTPLVCAKVCRQIGLPIESIVTTKDLDGLNDTQLEDIAERGTIFAKLTPMQKASVIAALKRRKHVVGFLGDGINDAPALKESDVGLSVDEAVDVAKESADVILLEKSLMVLVDGVIEGRKTFGNTIKYLKMAVSGNFGNVFSLVIAAAWLPFPPMQPVHLVIQNFLYDSSQIAIPWDVVDKSYLTAPKTWSTKSIVTFMLCMGPLSSIFDVATFLFGFSVYDCSSDADACRQEFQTSWFLEGLITQALIVHMIRTRQIPFIQSWAGWPLIVSTLGAVLLAFLIVVIPGVPDLVDMKTPRAAFFGFLAACIVGYCLLSQLAKFIYIKVFGMWL